MPTTGDKIRVLRKSHNWDQQDLAERVGVKRNTISMWEQNKRQPGRDSCEALADVFNVQLSYFYDNNQSEIPNTGIIPGTSEDDMYIKTKFQDTKLLCSDYEVMPESLRMPILKMVNEARKTFELLQQNERNDDNADAQS